MAEYPLDKPFVTSGEWWLPDNPNRKIPGMFTYENQGGTIRLQDSFAPFSGAVQISDTQEYAVLHGLTEKAEAITVFQAMRSGQSLNFNSGGLRQPERLAASVVLIGGHATGQVDFSEMRFRTPGLLAWYGERVVEGHQQHDASGGFEVEYRVKAVEKFSHHFAEIDAEVEFASSSSHRSDPFASIAVETHGWITVRPAEPQPLDWYLRQQRKVSKFLMFAAGFLMSPDIIQGKVDEVDVSLLVSLTNHQVCGFSNPSDFFLTRKELGLELTDAMSSWFSIYEELHTPSTLVESIVASEGSWLHIETLALMQALEGLHRALHHGSYMDQSDYDSVRDALVQAIPPDVSSDHRASLKSRIRYGNQVSLAKRINELSEYFDAHLRRRLLGSNQIPRSWIDTRNYFTHWDEELRNNVLDGQDLYFVNLRIRTLLFAAYLHLIGVSDQVILGALDGASRLAQRFVFAEISQQRALDPEDTSGVLMTVSEKPRDQKPSS